MPVINQGGVGAGDPPYSKYYTIKTTDWVNNRAVLHDVDDVLPSSTGQITWAPETLKDPDLPSILLCGVRLYAQGEGTITLSCEAVPPKDVHIQISVEESD